MVPVSVRAFDLDGENLRLEPFSDDCEVVRSVFFNFRDSKISSKRRDALQVKREISVYETHGGGRLHRLQVAIRHLKPECDAQML